MTIAEREYDVSRFHLDPGIPDDVARSIKRDWVDNYFTGARGDRMFVAEHDGEVAGFQLVLDTPEAAVIDLIAVAGSGARSGDRQLPRMRPGRVKPGPIGAGGNAGRQPPGVAAVRAARLLRGADGLRSPPARLMRIGPVDTDRQVAVIAEIGNNHEGDIATARELVGVAAGAGAHAVKLQAIEPAELVGADDTARLDQLRRFQLTAEQFAELAELAHSLGIGFVCTPFSLGAVGWLEPLVDAFKVASGDNDYLALLERIGATGRPVIVSAGMTGVHGLARAQRVLRTPEPASSPRLHCVSAYPTPPEAARLATIPVLARELGATIGYSDHTIGVEACLAAVALGARILEKHFTLTSRLQRLPRSPAVRRAGRAPGAGEAGRRGRVAARRAA